MTAVSDASPEIDSRARRAARAFGGWWFPPLPLARVAVLRVIVYAFVIIDVLTLTHDVVQHGYVPRLYQPTLLARVLHVPSLPVAGAYALMAVVIASCLGVISGRFPRASGWLACASFWWWMLDSQGFSYVSHDHLSLMVATLVLPTVGAARYRDQGTSDAAGWALRCVQVAVVATYFGSALSKWARTGSLVRWANGAVFTWALTRRGSGAFHWALNYPQLLRVAQWGLVAIEVASPVVLFLRRWWLYGAIALFFSFHFATYLALGIHFLPTVVCWFAFVPLERVVPSVTRLLPPHSEAG